MNVNEERARYVRLRPEEVILAAEATAIVLGYVLAWAAQRIKPLVDSLASEHFREALRDAGSKMAARSDLVQRHRLQIAREFEE